MPTSPKCIECLKRGINAQTYKVAGKPSFKCTTCKRIFPKDSFTNMEMLWKSDPEAYKEWLRSKGIEMEPNGAN